MCSVAVNYHVIAKSAYDSSLPSTHNTNVASRSIRLNAVSVLKMYRRMRGMGGIVTSRYLSTRRFRKAKQMFITA